MLIFKKGYICCGCGRRFSEEDAFAVYKKSCLCAECRNRLPRTDEGCVMEGPRDVSMLLSPFVYDGLYRKIFLEFKFGGNYAFGHLLGMAAAGCFDTFRLKERYDCMIPVPLSKERMNQRGYNQTEIMAEYVSEDVGIPLQRLLTRTRHCPAQSSLHGAARARNVSGAFAANAALGDRHVILFDDVFTTGSTINECARVLKAAGAKEVCAVCAARTAVKNHPAYA